MTKHLASLKVLFLIALLCGGTCVATDAAAEIKAFVSILPQKYFVERIGGNLVEVAVLVGPGQSPATYEPTPRQMAELSKAKVLFRIGVPFENSLLPKITSTFKDLVIVDTREGIKLRKMSSDHEHKKDKHRKEEEDDHRHGAGTLDPHIWLDPILVKTQAKTICEALSKLDSKNAKVYQQNLKKFLSNLDQVDVKIGRALAPMKGKEILVFHPAYGYFAHRYGLKQVAVETGGKEPSAKQLAALIEKAKAAGVKVIFVQPQFNKNNAETVARAIGGAVVSLNPLAVDYIKNLEEMASKVESALSKGN